MSSFVIPTLADGTPWYTLSCELEGVTYQLELRWNARDDAWFLTISDVSSNVLLANRKVVLGPPLTWRFKGAALPPGDFVVLDTTNQGIDAGLTDLGARVQLLYFESTDFPPGYISR